MKKAIILSLFGLALMAPALWTANRYIDTSSMWKVSFFLIGSLLKTPWPYAFFGLSLFIIGSNTWQKSLQRASLAADQKARQDERARMAAAAKTKVETFQRASMAKPPKRSYHFANAKRDNALRRIKDLIDKGASRSEMLARLHNEGINIHMRTLDRYLSERQK